MAAQPREEQTETMRLMEKRKKLQEAERALAESRKSFAEEMELLDKRKEAYDKKKAEFTRQARTCDVIFKSNEEKQANDRKKTEADRRAFDDLTLSIQAKQRELESHLLAQKYYEAGCERYKCYQDFLERVFNDDSQTFQTIKARHETLANECAGLEAKIREYAVMKEDLTKTHAAATMAQQNQIFALNARLDSLQKEIKDRRAESTQQESSLHVETDALVKAREVYSRVILAIGNIHQQLKREIDLVTASTKPGVPGGKPPLAAAGPATFSISAAGPPQAGAGERRASGSRLNKEEEVDTRSREEIRLDEIRQRIALLTAVIVEYRNQTPAPPVATSTGPRAMRPGQLIETPAPYPPPGTSGSQSSMQGLALPPIPATVPSAPSTPVSEEA